ncbi:MAG: hypothetical protein WCS52_04325 [bacterium]
MNTINNSLAKCIRSVLAGLLGAGVAMVSVAHAGSTSTVGFVESFEPYTNGFQISGTNGWGALNPLAGIVSTNVIDNGGSYPVPGASHTNVLQITDEITNTLVSPTGGVVVLDCMAMPTVAQWPPTTDANWRYAFYLNTSSNLVVWHYDKTGTSNRWTTLTGGPSVTNGVWARFTVEQDYGHGLFQIRVNNGAWITAPEAWTGPDGSSGGSWFSMAQPGGIAPTNMNGFGIAESQTNYLDDLVLTNRQVTWSANGFTEGVTNNGMVNSTLSIGLIYDTFAGNMGDDFVASNRLLVANLPSNLTAMATYASPTLLTVSLTGVAQHHEATNSTNLVFTFLNTAFTLGNAADVYHFSNSLSLTFSNTPQLNYSSTNFNEDSAANDGSINNMNPMVMTLTNALFAGTVGDDFFQQGKVQVGNLPGNLVAVMTLTNQTQLSVILTNKALANDALHSFSNLVFTFVDGAFSNVPAYSVVGASRTNLSITFIDSTVAQVLQYGSTVFWETVTNNGAVDGTNLTLTGKTFAGTNGEDLVASGKVVVSNVPGNLTMQLVQVDSYDLSLGFVGLATNHLALNSVSNLTVRFTDSAFIGGGAVSVSNSTMTDLVIRFHDQPSLSWDSTTFTEAASNDGSIATTNTVTLTDPNGVATFANTGYALGMQYTTSGVPAGLSVGVWYQDATHLKVALSGTAAAHAVGNSTSFSLLFQNAAFTPVAAANITGSTASLSVTFHDQPSLSWDSATFTEAAANDGSIATTNTVTLTDPNGMATFANTGYALGTQYTTSGVPAGLNVGVWYQDATHLKVALSGTAAAHAAANSTSFSLLFRNAAFTPVLAANITGSTASLSVTFHDQAQLTYSGDTFTELSQGAINNSSPITIDLVRDTFTGGIGSDFVAAQKVAVANLPGGLTVAITKSSDTQLSVQLAGTAYYNDVVNSIPNLTFQFQDAAFSNVAASRVVNRLKSDLKINFINDTPFSYQVPYVETLEGYTNGYWMTATNGWSAENAAAGVVTNDNSVGSWAHAYQGPVPVTASHTNELYVQSDLQSEIHSLPGQMVYTDFSVWPAPMVDSPQISTAMQLAFYVSTNGQFVLWHQNRTGGVTNNELRVLSSAPFIDTNRWLRVTVCQDYSNAMFQVRLNNGAPLTDTEGWTGPGGAPGGSWFHMVQTNSHMSGFGIAGVGSGYVDDLTVRTNLVNQAPVVLSLSPTVFNETVESDGIIDNSNSNRISLAGAVGATFAGNNGDLYGSGTVQASNLPPTLSVLLARTSPTNLSVSLTGYAANHFIQDSVSNMVINVLDGAFTIGSANIAGAANIIGISQSGLEVRFRTHTIGAVYLIR